MRQEERFPLSHCSAALFLITLSPCKETNLLSYKKVSYRIVCLYFMLLVVFLLQNNVLIKPITGTIKVSFFN